MSNPEMSDQRISSTSYESVTRDEALAVSCGLCKANPGEACQYNDGNPYSGIHLQRHAFAYCTRLPQREETVAQRVEQIRSSVEAASAEVATWPQSKRNAADTPEFNPPSRYASVSQDTTPPPITVAEVAAYRAENFLSAHAGEPRHSSWQRTITPEKAIEGLTAIFDDLQDRYHDQWNHLGAAFSLEVLRCTIEDLREKAAPPAPSPAKDESRKVYPEGEPIPPAVFTPSSGFHAWLLAAPNYGVMFIDAGRTFIDDSGSGPVEVNIGMLLDIPSARIPASLSAQVEDQGGHPVSYRKHAIELIFNATGGLVGESTIEYLDKFPHDCKSDAERIVTSLVPLIERLLKSAASVSPVEPSEPKVSHAQMCVLGRIFNKHAHQDLRSTHDEECINEWLKFQVSRAVPILPREGR